MTGKFCGNVRDNCYPHIRLLPTHPHLASADFIRLLPVATSAHPLITHSLPVTVYIVNLKELVGRLAILEATAEVVSLGCRNSDCRNRVQYPFTTLPIGRQGPKPVHRTDCRNVHMSTARQNKNISTVTKVGRLCRQLSRQIQDTRPVAIASIFFNISF